MEIKAIAHFRSPFKEKFGIPRQSSVVEGLKGFIELDKDYRREEALRGLENFDYLWLIWGFNLNNSSATSLMVRPPRLGGNEKVGVFASRSPFRPNSLGLSSVKILSIDFEKGLVEVSGADLADGTPIYDIKPYVTYCDSHPQARSGFVEERNWHRIKIEVESRELEEKLLKLLGAENYDILKESLSQDPRPQYQKKSNPTKSYGLLFDNFNITFHCEAESLVIDGITPASI